MTGDADEGSIAPITAEHARWDWVTPYGETITQHNPTAREAPRALWIGERQEAVQAALDATWQPLNAQRRACWACPDDNARHQIGCVVIGDGLNRAYWVCTSCGQARQASGVKNPAEWKASPPPPVMDWSGGTPTCERCGAAGTQLHHYAPWSVFGDDESNWATGYLCPSCHRHWHTSMNGYRWGLNGAAS